MNCPYQFIGARDLGVWVKFVLRVVRLRVVPRPALGRSTNVGHGGVALIPFGASAARCTGQVARCCAAELPAAARWSEECAYASDCDAVAHCAALVEPLMARARSVSFLAGEGPLPGLPPGPLPLPVLRWRLDLFGAHGRTRLAVQARGRGWVAARDLARVRHVALYWHERAGVTGCSPGGTWAARDRLAFEADWG